VPVKLGFIILSLIGVLRIPEEFYLYKDKDKLPRSLDFRGIIKRTDDHIFEKILKIELSPIPQAYTLKTDVV
jgi:hypothetical protein